QRGLQSQAGRQAAGAGIILRIIRLPFVEDLFRPRLERNCLAGLETLRDVEAGARRHPDAGQGRFTIRHSPRGSGQVRVAVRRSRDSGGGITFPLCNTWYTQNEQSGCCRENCFGHSALQPRTTFVQRQVLMERTGVACSSSPGEASPTPSLGPQLILRPLV